MNAAEINEELKCAGYHTVLSKNCLSVDVGDGLTTNFLVTDGIIPSGKEKIKRLLSRNEEANMININLTNDQYALLVSLMDNFDSTNEDAHQEAARILYPNNDLEKRLELIIGLNRELYKVN